MFKGKVVGLRVRSLRPLWCHISGKFEAESEFQLSAGDSARKMIKNKKNKSHDGWIQDVRLHASLAHF